MNVVDGKNIYIYKVFEEFNYEEMYKMLLLYGRISGIGKAY